MFLLPQGLALDLLSWTVGLAAWPFIGGAWPGAALGALLAPHPTLSWILVTLFAMVCGAAPWVAIGALFQLARRVLADDSDKQ